MKLTMPKLQQLIREELIKEMGEVVDLFPYKVMTNASGEPAKFKNLEAAIATAKAWDADGILMPEGTSDEVLDVVYHGEPLDPIAQRYDDEERDIKMAGPAPQMSPKEHEEYMALYDDDDDEEDKSLTPPETKTPEEYKTWKTQARPGANPRMRVKRDKFGRPLPGSGFRAQYVDKDKKKWW